MKRLICILLGLLLCIGCGQKVVSPSHANDASLSKPTTTASSTISPTEEPATPLPANTPQPSLATFAPKTDKEALFTEELLSQDGEPLFSQIRFLLLEEDLSKQAFSERFTTILRQIESLSERVRRLSDQGRTLTAARKEMTIRVLQQLSTDDMLDALNDAYSKCAGEGEDHPLLTYAGSMNALLQDVESMEERVQPFFSLDSNGAREYKAVLSRYMGEPVDTLKMLNALEELTQTEAYAIQTALQADPEVVRKKEPISYGSFSQNMSRLTTITQKLSSLPEDTVLPVPYGTEAEREMDLLQLAFRQYPGLTFLRLYGTSDDERRVRWENAPDGYLAGLAVHNCYAIIPYLNEFELEYVQYRWYEEMLYVTLTGISSLLIHYYGYSVEDLSAYLKGWGADAWTDYLYEKAMFDPFESLVAAYGYTQYLDICQACLDAGCDSEQQFFQDYLTAGPAPFLDLKEYMVGLYQNQG